MRRKLRRLGASAATITMVIAIASVPAQAEPATGTLTGLLTEADAPVPFASVEIYDAERIFLTATGTGADGRYSIDLAPGRYAVSFSVPGLNQFAHQKDFSDPDFFTVTEGATTTVDEQLIPTGSLSGTVTDAGHPVGGIVVHAAPAGTQPSGDFTGTDEQGRFEFPRLRPGPYLLEFDLPGGARFYYPGTPDPNDATRVSVAAGAGNPAVTVAVPPTGSGGGRILDAGAPVEHAFVTWSTADDVTTVSAETGADGRYALPRVFSGSYRVHVSLPDGRSQFAHGQLERADAGLFTVAPGGATVVDETMLPTGRVRVKAVDSRRRVVADACAEIRGVFQCTTNGVMDFPKVPVGRHPVRVTPNSGEDLDVGEGTVTVPAGGTATVTVVLPDASFITTVVRDKVTGAPVEGACMRTVRLIQAGFPDGVGSCSDEQGRLKHRVFTPGTYAMFVEADEGGYGAQWVGPYGGTGDQYAARRVTIAQGQAVRVPTVFLDKAGDVTGRVVDAATGQPVRDATVGLLPPNPGVGEVGRVGTTDADGRYTLSGLGPYAWPLFFFHPSYASQWSGAKPTRQSAIPVAVTTGGTSTADASLTGGTIVRGRATQGGQPVREFAFVIAYSTPKGDIAGVGFTDENGDYTVRVFGPVTVRLSVNDGFVNRYHRNAADFAHATNVSVPANGTKTVHIAFP